MAARTARRCPTVARDRPFAISSGRPIRIRPTRTYQVEYAVLTRDADGTVRVRHDQHIEGLFPEATWLSLMTDVGLQAVAVDDPEGRVVFVGTRPVPESLIAAQAAGLGRLTRARARR